jgi:hypothetical protein
MAAFSRTKKIVDLLLRTVGLMLLSMTAQATIYVVDINGIGNPNGCFSLDSTHNDISVALAAARIDATLGPHTIYICDGAYSEAGSLNITNDNLIGLTVQGESLTNVVITGAAGADMFNVHRDGVTFTNFTTNSGRFAFETNATGTDITLDTVIINNTANDSVRLNANTVTLTDVTINNTGTTANHDGILANATVDGAFTATRLTINNSGGYCARLRGGEPDTLVTFTETVLTNCGRIGLRTEAAADKLTIDDITVNGTGDNHCLQVLGGDLASNGNVRITNATLNDCGDAGNDAGLFLNVTGGDTGAMVDVSDITVNDSAGRGIYVNNARAINGGIVTFDNLIVNTTNNAEGIYFNNSHYAQITDLIIFDAGTDGLYVRGGDFMAIGVDNLSDNTITNSGDDGIYLANNANDNTFNKFVLTSNTDDAIYINNSKRNVFTDIEIDQMNVGRDGVVLDNNANDDDFNNVNVTNTIGDCVRVDDGNNMDYINSTLSNCAGYGFNASPAAETGLYLDNVDISDTRNHALYVGNYTAGNIRLFDVTVTNAGGYVPGPATVVNTARGIWIDDSSGVQLQDFVITNTNGDGLLFDNADGTVVSVSALAANVVTNAGDATNDNGVEFVNNADNGSYSNINITNSFDDGMLLSTSIDNTISNITVTNPAGASNDGIVLTATATGNSFTNIYVDNVADDCFATNASNTTLSTAELTNCDDMGLLAQITPDAIGVLTLDDIDITTTLDDGMFIDGFAAGSTVNVSNVTILNAGDYGLNVNATFDGSFTDLDIQNSVDFGIFLNTSSANNTFGVSSFTKNIIDGNEDGIQIQGSADGNIFSDFIVSNSNDDGVIFSLALNNTFENSEVINNAGVGVTVTATSTGNTIDNNLVLENGVYGAQVFNTGVSSGNTFVDNCFRNSSNVTDGGNGAVNNFDDGARGNFWGSLALDASGYSESCTDDRATDDDICDFAYAIPGVGSSSDNFPLQFCDAFAVTDNVSLQFWKTVLTINDTVNSSNYKAIPGATMRYTLTVTNNANSGVRSGMAQDPVIVDDFTNEIVTENRLTWSAGSMVRTAPDYNLGAATVLTDADAADDDADFGVTVGNAVTVNCGDLNASETCTLTFEVEIQ